MTQQVDTTVKDVLAPDVELDAQGYAPLTYDLRQEDPDELRDYYSMMVLLRRFEERTRC